MGEDDGGKDRRYGGRCIGSLLSPLVVVVAGGGEFVDFSLNSCSLLFPTSSFLHSFPARWIHRHPNDQPKDNDTKRVVRAHGEFGTEKLVRDPCALYPA
jgi:hypothetical protein